MEDEYDFSKMEEVKNAPYKGKIKKHITMYLDQDIIEYFKGMSQEVGIPYQRLVNLYLSHCKDKKIKLKIDWAA